MKVTIENHDGNLRLRWTCPETGKRKTLALGVPDSTAGRSSALGLKDRIENDIKHGYYDATLLRYRPKTIGKNPTEITTVELFDRFTQYQAKKLTKSSIDARYHPVTRMLEKHLNIEAGIVDRRRADVFADICEDTLSSGTAKARIQLLRAAWGWGKDKYQLSIDNPWDGLAERFKAVDTQPVAAFSRDEVSKIIKGFKDSPYYAHYHDYVVFRFGMGTRGGEASGLKWKHIAADFSSVWIGESYSRGVTGTTKTKRARTINLSLSISKMLSDRRERLNPVSDDELVFTTPTGLHIEDRNFCRRAWKMVLADVGVKYRRPYTTRKTAISHSLAAGVNYIDVAAAAGHNPQTMHKHYADSISKGSVFVDF